MNRHQELIDACRRGDRVALHRLGWDEPFEAIKTWWWSRDPFTLADFKSYADALGSYPPEVVLAALPDAAGKWRPRPGELLSAVRTRQRSDASSRTNAGRNHDPANDSAALAATLEAVRAGAHVCQCGAPPSIRWHDGGRGVWCCPTCNGLEQGQVYRAEDAAAANEALA